jgi:hypothetical protein
MRFEKFWIVTKKLLRFRKTKSWMTIVIKEKQTSGPYRFFKRIRHEQLLKQEESKEQIPVECLSEETKTEIVLEYSETFQTEQFVLGPEAVIVEDQIQIEGF